MHAPRLAPLSALRRLSPAPCDRSCRAVTDSPQQAQLTRAPIYMSSTARPAMNLLLDVPYTCIYLPTPCLCNVVLGRWSLGLGCVSRPGGTVQARGAGQPADALQCSIIKPGVRPRAVSSKVPAAALAWQGAGLRRGVASTPAGAAFAFDRAVDSSLRPGAVHWCRAVGVTSSSRAPPRRSAALPAHAARAGRLAPLPVQHCPRAANRRPAPRTARRRRGLCARAGLSRGSLDFADILLIPSSAR